MPHHWTTQAWCWKLNWLTVETMLLFLSMVCWFSTWVDTVVELVSPSAATGAQLAESKQVHGRF
jgi:hypothetical protein